MLRLRWRHEGKRYGLCFGKPDSPLWRLKAKELATQIEQDMAYGSFDATLRSYRQQGEPPPSTVNLFQQFIESRRASGTGEYSLKNRYGVMLTHLTQFGRDINTPTEALDFMEHLKQPRPRGKAGKLQAISDRTRNEYLSLLKRFSQWAVNNDYWEANPFRQIEPIRTEKNRASREAFTEDERDRILTSLRFHPHYRHYHSFVAALFFLGFRESEIIGLQWKHIDLENATITICESLSRGTDGKSSGRARQRKATKTGTERTHPLNSSQVQMLSKLQPDGVDPISLVFPSPTGIAIDDHNFSQRVWRAILSTARVEPYRPPYATRHTFATWAKRHGMTDEQLAYWMGHKTTRMVREHYGHLDNQPQVPEFDIEGAGDRAQTYTQNGF
jgi:integrase